MTQELYCAHRDGSVLVSDSLVIRQHEDGRRDRLAARKLFALGPRTAIVSGGAAAGISFSLELARAVRDQRLVDVEDILALAPAFLNERYEAFVAQARPWFDAHPDAYQRLYFLMAGCSTGGLPARVLLLGSERVDTPLTPFPVGAAIAMPRRLGLEMRLMKLAPSVGLAELAGECLNQLALLARVEPDAVGGPFDGVILTPAGLRPAIADAPSRGS